MPYREQSISIKKIYLDPENPRHDPIEHETEIIKHLIEHEQVKKLAQHIAEVGEISPLEKIAVIPHPTLTGSFIAVEGNRRTCALKLLAEPEKADSPSNQKYFQNLASRIQSKIDKVSAVVFDSVKEAHPWISLRHEGAQGGIGTKSWTTPQQARFNQKSPSPQRNPNIQAALLVNYAKENNLLPSEALDKASLTTITRYLGNPIFRNTIGLKSKDSLTIDVSTDEFNRVITKFLTDATTSDSEVSSRTKASDRETYAQKLRESDSAPTVRGLELKILSPKPEHAPQTPESTPESKENVPASGAPATLPPKARNNPNPDHRRKVIPTGFAINIKNKTLKRMYDELRIINADDLPFAATYLFRSVIEHSVTLYLNQIGRQAGNELHRKIGAAAIALESDGVNTKLLKNLRTMANNTDSPISPESIGHTIHGGHTPTRTELIRHWDSLEAPLLEILKRLK
ncbi:hypothetical protein SAMN04244572_04724 [Azotobacter beijerinckii]|uniref:ParB/Sulfiredoxin domain-containing protein n=1 Tax=Azotobacter beijerinckii TaxID=170623 RepID=A0A1H7AD00_9GAMM|nr:hypothetical protein [Azotobacter beijerinckii]SEJ63471.1 hypothetical protein SAMN04244572_04724 [Azotobacter beijerinckii]